MRRSATSDPPPQIVQMRAIVLWLSPRGDPVSVGSLCGGRSGQDVHETESVLSAYLMFHRFVRALKVAAREEGFVQILGAAALLVIIGTITYSASQGWSIVNGFYFAIATLTTSSIADPHLTLESNGIKIFTVFVILIGIGILVELARQVGFAFVEVRREDQALAGQERRQGASKLRELALSRPSRSGLALCTKRPLCATATPPSPSPDRAQTTADGIRGAPIRERARHVNVTWARGSRPRQRASTNWPVQTTHPPPPNRSTPWAAAQTSAPAAERGIPRLLREIP